ncbi:hypothetical protein BHM03_00024217 [Ensete ventricosum]|nr:hypothetical protein BHM03_00024217 [Ensete ventricosum]
MVLTPETSTEPTLRLLDDVTSGLIREPTLELSRPRMKFKMVIMKVAPKSSSIHAGAQSTVSRLEAQEANKALEEEQQRALALEKGVIATYKESKEFRCGLVWSRQTSYQYGYLVALEHFKAKYLGMSIKEDPFTHPT